MRTKLVLLVIAVAVLGTDLYLLSQRSQTTAVELADVLSEFQEGGDPTTSLPGPVPAPQPELASGAVPVDAAPAADPAAPEATAPAVDPAAPDPAAPVAPVEPETPVDPGPQAEPTAYRLPEEGVYTYSAQGGETISLLGANHTYGPVAYATVRHLGGCEWEHRLSVVREHIDIRRLCSQPGAYLQAAQNRQITFLGQTEGSEMACNPQQLHHAPGEAPGATGTSSCSGSGGYNGTLTRTYLGTELIDVGGTVVEAVRVNIDSALSGTSVGTSYDQLWLHPETGMTLRWDRTVDTVASVFGASVRYRERASFVLQSLVPQR